MKRNNLDFFSIIAQEKNLRNLKVKHMSPLFPSEALNYLVTLSSNYNEQLNSLIQKHPILSSEQQKSSPTLSKLPLVIKSLADPQNAFCEKPSILKRICSFFFSQKQEIKITVNNKIVSAFVKNYDDPSNIAVLRTLFASALGSKPSTISATPPEDAAKLHNIIAFALQLDQEEGAGSCAVILKEYALEKMKSAKTLEEVITVYDDPVYQKALLQEAEKFPQQSSISKAAIDTIFSLGLNVIRENDKTIGNLIGNILRMRWMAQGRQRHQTDLTSQIEADWNTLLHNRENSCSTEFYNILNIHKHAALLQACARLNIAELPNKVSLLIANIRGSKLDDTSRYQILSPLQKAVEALSNLKGIDEKDREVLKRCAKNIDAEIPKDWWKDLPPTQKVNVVAQSTFLSLKIYGWGLVQAMGSSVLFTVVPAVIGFTTAPITVTAIGAAAATGTAIYVVNSLIPPIAEGAGTVVGGAASICGASPETQENAKNVASTITKTGLIGTLTAFTFFRRFSR